MLCVLESNRSLSVTIQNWYELFSHNDLSNHNPKYRPFVLNYTVYRMHVKYLHEMWNYQNVVHA